MWGKTQGGQRRAPNVTTKKKVKAAIIKQIRRSISNQCLNQMLGNGELEPLMGFI
jgi:hypothetical protein